MSALFFSPIMTSPAQLWITLILAGMLTYAIRLSFILIFHRIAVPDWLQRALRYVPPAVLTAIIFPELLIQDGRLAISLENGRLIAGLVAILIAWRTKNALLTIVVGMAILWLVQWIH